MKDICPICYDPLRTLLTRFCANHHSFHKPCIDKWKLKSNTCPVCRQNMVYREIMGPIDLQKVFGELQVAKLESFPGSRETQSLSFHICYTFERKAHDIVQYESLHLNQEEIQNADYIVSKDQSIKWLRCCSPYQYVDVRDIPATCFRFRYWIYSELVQTCRQSEVIDGDYLYTGGMFKIKDT